MKSIFNINFCDYKGIKANFHTHTYRCKHASGEDREYIEAAIKAGYQVLGFSDHSPYPFGEYQSPIRMEMGELENYVDSVLTLKKEYERNIRIFLGLETEYFPDFFEGLMKKVRQYPLDFMLLGQHYFDSELSRKHTRRARTEEEFLIKYVDQVLEGMRTGYFNCVAHPDIINYTGDIEVYRSHMRRLAEEAKKLQMPLEVNVNGYRDGCNYPNGDFIDLMVEVENDILIGVDSHAPKELLDEENYHKCVELVRNRGGKVFGEIFT